MVVGETRLVKSKLGWWSKYQVGGLNDQVNIIKTWSTRVKTR